MAQVPAADATLRIINFLSAQRGPVPAQTIATALKIPRSSIYQLLQVLCAHGFVLHLPEEKRYGLGFRVFELSSAYSRQQPLTRLAAPLLAKMVDHIGESAHLAVLQGTDVLYLIEERAPHRPSLITDVGVRLPAHLTASGRALLSALPAAQLRALYSSAVLPEYSSSSATPGPTRYRDLKRILDMTREHGFAVERGEITPGFSSVGVVVRDHVGWPAAAVAVTFSSDGADETADAARSEAMFGHLAQVASELGRRIRGIT